MKLLKEDVLFGSNDVNLLKKVYAKSSGSSGEINYSSVSEKEQKRVENILEYLQGRSEGQQAASKYMLLKAACYGPDEDRNDLLKYVLTLPGECWDKDKVSIILDFLISGEIEFPKSMDSPHLFNPSLYQRNDNDFVYSVKAFNAVIFQKKKYFNNKNIVDISLLPNEWKVFFPETKVPSFNTSDELNVDGTVDISDKFFYKEFETSVTGIIIPAGINSSNRDERTIWNYMEIWSNPTDESSSNKAEQARNKEKEDREFYTSRQKRDAADALKKFINNTNASNDQKSAAVKVVDQLL